ncbi:MAG: NAD(P)H-dependent oxidoreductase [Bacteroides sp.]|nr:NAD(P)H-dependent oxidoreductase [Bacteroides sp.]
MNESGKVLILLAHPNINTSRANKEMIDFVRDEDGVVVIDLYEHATEEFDLDFWSRQMSEASALIFQFPLYWMSAPYMLKRWQDEVFIHLSKSPIILGKPCLVVTSTGSEQESYRSRGRNRYTIDEILRPYQASILHAGMTWRTPIVIYAAGAEDAGKRISICASKYKTTIEELLTNNQRIISSEW